MQSSGLGWQITKHPKPEGIGMLGEVGKPRINIIRGERHINPGLRIPSPKLRFSFKV